MKKVIAVFIWFTIFPNLYSQSTFEYKYTSPLHEVSRSMIEDGEGNIYFPVENFQYALIIKLSSEGIFRDSIHLINPYGSCNIGELINYDEDHFIALGNWSSDSTSELWYILFDNNLQVIEDNKLDSEGGLVHDFKHIINHNQNIVFMAHYLSPAISSFDICLYEITFAGTIIRKVFFGTQTLFNQGFTLLENSYDNSYKIFTRLPLPFPIRASCALNYVDSNFDVIDTASYFDDFIYTQNTAKWINDSIYLVTGKRLIIEPEEWDIGIHKMSISDSIISSRYFGEADTVEWPGLYKNLDFISTDNIFFAGTKNSWWYPFQQESSWIMLSILDSDLNLNHQQFYGGDAYYLVNAILATQDSGCVMACSRYDYLTQDEEFDVFILKVNKDGLLVGTPETESEIENLCRLYPNPGGETLTIDIPKSGLRLTMSDISGIVRFSRNLENRHNILPVSALPTGMYFYRIVNEKNEAISVGKWIKL